MARLSTYGNGSVFEESAIPGLAAAAAKQWTAGFNPRTIQASDFILLYEQLFQNYIDCPAVQKGAI